MKESKNSLLDQLGIGHLEIFVPSKKDEVAKHGKIETDGNQQNIEVRTLSQIFANIFMNGSENYIPNPNYQLHLVDLVEGIEFERSQVGE